MRVSYNNMKINTSCVSDNTSIELKDNESLHNTETIMIGRRGTVCLASVLGQVSPVPYQVPIYASAVKEGALPPAPPTSQNYQASQLGILTGCSFHRKLSSPCPLSGLRGSGHGCKPSAWSRSSLWLWASPTPYGPPFPQTITSSCTKFPSNLSALWFPGNLPAWRN